MAFVPQCPFGKRVRKQFPRLIRIFRMMKEISIQYRLLLCERYSQKHASDYKRNDAARIKKAVRLLENDVLEVLFNEKWLP